MSDIRQDIEKLLDQYRECWSRLDFDGLRGLWDTEETAPLYVAEEAPAALLDWPGIEAYWRGTREGTASVRIETANHQVRQLPEGLASVVFDMRWRGLFRGHERAIGGETRVTALLRRKPAGWRFVHYVEAPLAPIVYFRRAYERFADSPPLQAPG